MKSFILMIALSAFLMKVLGFPTQSSVPADKECKPMDVIFLLDTSRSVWRPDFQQQLQFTSKMVSQLDVGSGPRQTRVGVISIGYSYYLNFYLRKYKTKEEVKNAILRIRHRQSYATNTGRSIRFMTHYMFRPFYGGRHDATRVAIVITDGLSQDSKSTKYESLLARKKGIKMFAIGVGLKKKEELLSIGSQPSDRYVFMVEDFNALDTVLKNLPKSSCEVAAISTKPPMSTKRSTFAPQWLNNVFVRRTTPSPSTIAPTTRDSHTTVLSKRGPTVSATTRNVGLTEVTTTHSPYSSETDTETTRNIHMTEATTTRGPTVPETTRNVNLTETTTQRGPTVPATTRNVNLTETTTQRGPTVPETTRNVNLTETTTQRGPTVPETTRNVHLTETTTQRGPTVPETTRNVGLTEATTTRAMRNRHPTDPLFNAIENHRTAPSTDNQEVNEIQYDAMTQNDNHIWASMFSNKISRDIAIADEPKQYCGGKNADIFFVLDSSNSIWPEDFKKQLEFVNDLVDTFDFRNNKTRVGVIVYSTDIHMKVSLHSGWTKEQIKRQVTSIKYVSGLTNTSDAIRYVRTYGYTEQNARTDTIKIGIVLTDGISRDPLATKRESKLCREEHITLFAIGIGKDIDKTELKRIANDPDDKFVFHVNSFGALASIRSLVAVSACGVVPDQPSNLLYCGSNSLADVIFVYDAPGLGARKARLLTSFVHDVSRGLQTSPGKLRIGRRTDNCPGISDIELTTESDLPSFSNIHFPGIESLINNLRMAFPNRLNAKNLAILFVDESTQSIEMATRVLKEDVNFHVMVVAIGDPSTARLASDLASQPHTDYLVNIPSYMELDAYRYEFLQKLCYLITNQPLFLRDARVRMPGNR